MAQLGASGNEARVSAVLTDTEREQRARSVLFRPDTFAFACTAGLREDARFMLPPHVRYLARAVVRAIRTPDARMSVELPVRHGKSVLMSHWLPAWYLGCFPDRRVMFASYEADFAATWGGKARDVLEEHGHLFGVRVNPASSARDRWDILGTPGGMVTAGVGGAITGRGADLLLIDDPFKNAEEALSATIREKRWDWFNSTAMTRLEPGGVAIVYQARWHEDDFIGRLHNPEYTPPGRWKRIRLPALAEEGDALEREPGDALWPERYDRETLEGFRAERGQRWFTALYQQSPQPMSGGIFKAEHLRTWRREGDYYLLRRDSGEDDRFAVAACTRFQTWDLAVSTKTTADYTVCATWALTSKRDLILIDLMRRRMEGPDISSAMHAEYARHLPAFVGIEGNGTQLTFVQQAQREGLPVKKLMPDGDKTARGISASTRYETHTVFHPPASIAPWLGEFELELLTFDKAPHDDMVDTVSYACWYASQGAMSNAWRELLERQSGMPVEAPVVDGVPLVTSIASSSELKPWQRDGFYDD